MKPRFSLPFRALPEHIDVMGHVNNAIWVQWMEVLATAHWEAIAPQAHQEAYAWVVYRHEIDYRGNIQVGDTVIGETFIPEAPRVVRFVRAAEFKNAAGQVLVSARTDWVMLNRKTLRPMRIPDAVAAPFWDEAA